MKSASRLTIAIQKKGRLNNDSIDLLLRCGLKMRISETSLLCHCENIPIDLLFMRDDDIPTLVMDQVCDLGIVGENVLQEYTAYQENNGKDSRYELVKKLGFSACRLAIAVPNESEFKDVQSLQGTRIATTYPHILRDFLVKQGVKADIVTISGSVEIAPRLGLSDAICDLVSTGRTLEENHLKEVLEVFKSQAVVIRNTQNWSPEKLATFELLLNRINAVLKAQESKYIMFHAPKEALAAIREFLPGAENPTIIPLEGTDEKVAVHVVSTEGVFWGTLEKLQQAGASSILVLPIEKMLP